MTEPRVIYQTPFDLVWVNAQQQVVAETLQTTTWSVLAACARARLVPDVLKCNGVFLNPWDMSD